MAKQKLSIEHALRLTIHHVAPHKIRIMESMPFDPETASEQFTMIRENCEAIQKRIAEIKAAAESGDCAKVLNLINEESVEAGHEYGPVTVPTHRLF